MNRRESICFVSFAPLLLLALLTCAAEANGQQQPPTALEQAIEAQKKGDLEGAVNAYRSYLRVDPNSFPAHANLGAALAGMGRFEDAIAEYRAALAIDPENPVLQFNLGLANFKSARIAEAAAEFKKVVTAQPDNRNAIVLLADCYLRMSEYKKVIDLLSPKLEQLGGAKDVVYLLGTAYIDDHQTEKGQVLIDRLLRQGDTPEVHLMMGAVRLNARDGRGAIEEIERAIQLNPNLITAHSWYGRALLQMGQQEAAAKAFRTELSINSTDFDSNLFLGVLLKADQKYDEALAYFRRALQIHPGAADVRYQIASVDVAIDNLAEAQPMLEQLVREAPDFREAHVSLATVYYRLKRKQDGDRERAIVQKLNAATQAQEPGVKKQPAQRADITSAPSAAPAVDQPRTGALATARKTFEDLKQNADAARENGDTDKAINLYHEALKLRADWSEGWWYLGSLLYTANKSTEARDTFEHLVKLVPKNGGAGWAMLGLCEFQLRDYPNATEHLGRGFALGLGNNAELTSAARYHLALLLNRAGESGSALQILLPLARTQSAHPPLIEALGLAALAERYLPSELPPEKLELTLEAGRAEYHSGARQLGDAEKEFRTLIQKYPKVSNLHYSLGIVLLLSNPDAALEEFSKELAITPSHVDARLQIAYEYLKRGQPKLGLPYAEAAVKLSPSSSPARSIFGRLLLKIGDVNRGIAELERGVKLAPASPEMAYALATAYAAAGRKEDAARERVEFKRLTELRKVNPADAPAAPQRPESNQN